MFQLITNARKIESNLITFLFEKKKKSNISNISYEHMYSNQKAGFSSTHIKAGLVTKMTVNVS